MINVPIWLENLKEGFAENAKPFLTESYKNIECITPTQWECIKNSLAKNRLEAFSFVETTAYTQIAKSVLDDFVKAHSEHLWHDDEHWQYLIKRAENTLNYLRANRRSNTVVWKYIINCCLYSYISTEESIYSAAKVLHLLSNKSEDKCRAFVWSSEKRNLENLIHKYKEIQ